MKAGKVYILILNWNNWHDTIECLESVLKNSYTDYQVVVIDNASTDDSEKRIIEWAKEKSLGLIKYDGETPEEAERSDRKPPLRHPCLVFIQTGSNLGYAGGNNVGIKYAIKKADWSYIWILNNDTVIDADALSEMVKLAELDEKTGMVGSKLLYHDRPDMLQAAGGSRIVPWAGNSSTIASNENDDGRWDEPFEPSYISGASLLVKKAVVESIGLMEEKYFLYWEDSDWAMRTRKEGFRIMYCPKSRVWHKEGGTSGYLSLQSDYYWIRNGLYFTRKFYPYFLPLIPFSYLAKYTIVRALKKQPYNLKAFRKALIDFMTGKTGPM